MPETLAVCRLDAAAPLPDWATASSSLWCIARTGDELSVVCEQSLPPAPIRAERGWRAFQLEGPMPFTLTGILASVLQPLAAARIGVFAFSTFDTDYVLVKAESVAGATAALTAAGHVIL